jgi:UDP-N-acetylglucosamine--N-acetylmuramyl-(pentapeptide) pyrophosphoryl-undecaprenol N-acetylglucosamine transferase
VLHQCGPGRRDEAPGAGPDLRVEEYLAPVAPALAAATLVLCRGGASTLAEVAAARRPAVVVPYPHHADRHQERNALELGDGVELVADGDLDGNLVPRLLALLGPGGAARREAMSAELAGRAPADAAGRLLLDLSTLASGRPATANLTATADPR